MLMNDCDKVKPLVSDYLEGDIFPENRKFIEDHISVCPKCNAAIRRVKELCQNLKSLPYLTTSQDFESRLHQRISHSNNGHSIRLTISGQNWRMPAFTVAAVLVVVAFVWMFNSNSPEPGSGMPMDNASVQSITTRQTPPLKPIPGSGDVNTKSEGTDVSATDSLQKANTQKDVQLVGDKE